MRNTLIWGYFEIDLRSLTVSMFHSFHQIFSQLLNLGRHIKFYIELEVTSISLPNNFKHQIYHRLYQYFLWFERCIFQTFWKLHSWPKFKIVLIKKWEGISTTSHFLYSSQNSWMVVVFPIQFFSTVVVFTI